MKIVPSMLLFIQAIGYPMNFTLVSSRRTALVDRICSLDYSIHVCILDGYLSSWSVVNHQ